MVISSQGYSKKQNRYLHLNNQFFMKSSFTLLLSLFVLGLHDALAQFEIRRQYVDSFNFHEFTPTLDHGFAAFGYSNVWSPSYCVVAKYDSTGAIQFVNKYWHGESGETSTGTACPDGGFIFTGCIATTPFGGIEAMATFLAKTDPQGNLIWTKRFDSPANDVPEAVAIGSDGSLFVAGKDMSADNRTVFKTDALGNLLWSLLIGAASTSSHLDVVPLDDGGCWLLDNTDLVRISTTGTIAWKRNIQFNKIDWSHGALTGRLGNRIALLDTSFNEPPKVFKLTSLKSLSVWHVDYDNGRFFIIGTCKTATTPSHYFCATIDSSGSVLSAKEAAAPNDSATYYGFVRVNSKQSFCFGRYGNGFNPDRRTIMLRLNQDKVYGCYDQNLDLQATSDSIAIGLGVSVTSEPNVFYPDSVHILEEAIPTTLENTLDCNSTDVDELRASVGFSIFPNPVESTLSIRASNYDFVTIRDMLGRQLMNLRISANVLDIDCKDLKSGVYTVSMTKINGQYETRKLMKL